MTVKFYYSIIYKYLGGGGGGGGGEGFTDVGGWGFVPFSNMCYCS